MIKHRTYLFLAITFLVSACAHLERPEWLHSSKTPQQRAADESECLQRGTTLYGAADDMLLSAVAGRETRNNRITRLCMEGKGYKKGKVSY